MSSSTYIYGLLCPAENKIRYLGKTDAPHQRYKVHLSAATGGPTPKDRWIRALREQNLKPRLMILEKQNVCNRDAEYRDVSREAEPRWIRRLLEEGHPLTNRITKPEQQARNIRRVRAALVLGTDD